MNFCRVFSGVRVLSAARNLSIDEVTQMFGLSCFTFTLWFQPLRECSWTRSHSTRVFVDSVWPDVSLPSQLLQLPALRSD